MVEREGKGTWRYEFDISHENRTMHGTNKKYSGKKEKSNYDVKLKNPKSILYYDTGKRQQLYHPTQKPLLLCEWLVKTYTNEGNIVLDNCMGSGTTGVACINTNRKFIGIELDENYFNIAKNRIEESLNNSN
jgi:site-specific DNA-methyltransferase (adenine-specific)